MEPAQGHLVGAKVRADPVCSQTRTDKKRNRAIEEILGPRPDAHKTLINNGMKYACEDCFCKSSFTVAYSLPLLLFHKPKHVSGGCELGAFYPCPSYVTPVTS